MGILRLALGLTLVVVAARSASAQPQTVAQQQADKLFGEGRELIAANRPAEACAKFEDALRLDPVAPGTMLNLGACYELLHKPRAALAWYRKTLALASEADMPAYEAAAKEHARSLAAIVPTLAIELAPSTPADATVQVDGELIAATDLSRIEVEPGHHVIAVTARDKLPFRREVDLALKASMTVSITLVAAAPPSIVDPDPGRGHRRLAYEVGAGGGALWLATLGYGLYERHVNDTGSIAQRNDAVHDLRIYGTTMFCVGAAAIGTGALLYVTAHDRERAGKTAWVPAVGRDGVGLAVIGTF